jgi:hypothetical protein
VNIGGLLTVNFPRNSVCDPNGSSYGPGVWDDNCAVISRPVTVHVNYGYVNGALSFNFSPELRFAPSKAESDWVTISTTMFASLITANRSYYASHPSALNNLPFYFVSGLAGQATKDWADDKTLLTHVDLRSGLVWRRIKHFSGYLVATGEACDPSPDNPDCIDVGDDR